MKRALRILRTVATATVGAVLVALLIDELGARAARREPYMSVEPRLPSYLSPRHHHYGSAWDGALVGFVAGATYLVIVLAILYLT